MNIRYPNWKDRSKALAQEEALLKALHGNPGMVDQRRKIADVTGDHGRSER